MTHSSKIFLKNRALGYVSNHIPCVSRYITQRQETVIITCVGKAFHSYGVNRLSLFTVSDSTNEDISCLTASTRRVYTANGCTIHSWVRSSVISASYNGHTAPVHLLLTLGINLISVDEDNNMKVWSVSTQEVELEITFDLTTFRISAIMHPYTYVNKILLGCEQGVMQLWNYKTSKLVHTFQGWNSSILVIEQAPALDVVGIGLMNGQIVLHNLKYDETIMEFFQDWGPVLTMGFRTDGPSILITGSNAGHLVVWDLEERKVSSQILNAHSDAVCSVICLPNEPLVVTSSPDNSLKIWIFDQSDNSGRLLRKREGHVSNPSVVRFYDGNPFHIISAGNDSSLRIFNTINENMNISLGRAAYNRKAIKNKGKSVKPDYMPPIVDISVSVARAHDWDNIAAAHLGVPIITLWSHDKRKMSDLKLIPQRWASRSKFSGISTTSLQMTNCGNFVLIGYSSGHLDRFNVQSGLHRCTYGLTSAHEGAIRGIAVDALNQFVISGCNQGLIKFWNFKPVNKNTVCKYP